MSNREFQAGSQNCAHASLDISLIVCTRNRAAYLPPHLQSLAELITDFATCEIIIVDNGSTDATPELLSSFAATFPDLVRVIREEAPGLARARNTGYKIARGELVAFTDDDCYPQPDFLQQVMQSFNTYEWDYFGGRVTLFDPLDAPITIKTDAQMFKIPAASHIAAGIIHGANFNFKKSVLERLGGFDVRFGAGAPLVSGEDMDIIARASAAGFFGGYDPQPTVAHHHRRRHKEEIDKLYLGYDVGRGAYYAKMLLVKNMRKIYLRHWYWRVRFFFLQRRFGQIYNEASGAARFLFSELFMRCGARSK
ncbi:MAG TPA: glycosyltransferase family A protein [Spongiibacteraceae bacterium]|nr:glycosyltransferase family A protein [Spongiibacteraceae bacterium]